MNLLPQFIVNGIVHGAILAILACGFGLVYRSVKVFHIAYAGIFLIAPYAMHVAHNLWSFPLWTALLFGVTVCAFAGYLLELMLYLSKRILVWKMLYVMLHQCCHWNDLKIYLLR